MLSLVVLTVIASYLAEYLGDRDMRGVRCCRDLVSWSRGGSGVGYDGCCVLCSSSQGALVRYGGRITCYARARNTPDVNDLALLFSEVFLVQVLSLSIY